MKSRCYGRVIRREVWLGARLNECEYCVKTVAVEAGSERLELAESLYRKGNSRGLYNHLSTQEGRDGSDFESGSSDKTDSSPSFLGLFSSSPSRFPHSARLQADAYIGGTV